MAAPREEGAAGGEDAWTLHLLGSVVRLVRRGVEIVPETRTAVLLTLLAVGGPLPRERAAALLWPDRAPGRARANLRQLLYRLRADADVVAGDPLILTPEISLDVDAIDVRAPLRSEGSLLDGYDLQDSGELADRFAAARARLVSRIRMDLERRVAEAERAGDTRAAAGAATRLAEFDPLDEAAVQRAMQLQLAQGDASGALHLFARTKEALERLLDVEPRPATVDLARRAASDSARAFGVLEPILGTASSADRSPPESSERLVRRAETRGWLAEGASVLRAQAASRPPGAQRARLLAQAAWLEHQAGRAPAAAEAAQAALDDLRADDDATTRIEAWFVLGSLARQRGDLAAAASWWDRALDLAGRRRGGTDEPSLHLNLGLVADSLGRSEDALEHYLAALPLAQARDDVATLALLWNNIGHVLLARRRPADARRLLIRSVEAADRSGDRRLRAYALEGLARCAAEEGDAATARSLAADALATANDLGDPVLRVEAALSVAAADALDGDQERSLTTARAALGVARRHANQPGSMRAVVIIAEILGPDEAIAGRAVAVLAADPRAAPDVRTRAAELAEAWGVAGFAAADPSAWDELVDELVTPR